MNGRLLRMDSNKTFNVLFIEGKYQKYNLKKLIIIKCK